MLSRAWIAVFAAGWIVSSAAAQTPSPHPEAKLPEPQREAHREHEPSDGQHEPTEEPSVETDGGASAISPTEPASDEHDAYSPGKGGEDVPNSLYFGDTVAQWIMAISGLIALGLSAWAVWLLRETLLATQTAMDIAEKGNAAAVKAAEAAERQAWIGSEALVAEQRAWMKIHDPTLESGLNRTPKPNGATTIALHIRAENIGKGAAQKCDLHLHARFTSFPYHGVEKKHRHLAPH